MKTTLDIDDKLLSKAKIVAVRESKTLTRLIEEGLALRLRKPVHRASGAPPQLPVFRGEGGLSPGIDPASNQSMYDAADT